MTVDQKKLEAAFHQAMLNFYDDATNQIGYRATRFKQLVHERGGLAAARQLLSSTDAKVSEGFTQLALAGRLDFSMEALVLSEPWKGLFATDELRVAERRLK